MTSHLPLSSLGVSPNQMFPSPFQEGRLLIPARITGDDTELLLDTGAQGTVVLDAGYAARRKLPVVEPCEYPPILANQAPRSGGKTTLQSVSVLGRTHSNLRTSVTDLLSHNDPLKERVAGYLGAGFFSAGVLVVSAASQSVVYSEARGVATAKLDASSLNLVRVRAESLPFTTDVRDGIFPEGDPPVSLLDTGSRGSYVSIDYVRRKPRRRLLRWFLGRASRRGKQVPWLFELPGGVPFRTHVHLVSFSPAYVASTGMGHVDAILGMDFFLRWTVVCDFPARVVQLLPAAR